MNTCATNSLSPPTYVQFTENSLNGQGLPWWSNSWEFAFQCRGCGFDPGMETKIPRVAGQLSLHASTTESSLQSPCSVTRESLQASMKTQRGQKKKKMAWFKDRSMRYAEVSYGGLLLPCKSTQRRPWVPVLALGKQWALYLVIPLYWERIGSR